MPWSYDGDQFYPCTVKQLENTVQHGKKLSLDIGQRQRRT